MSFCLYFTVSVYFFFFFYFLSSSLLINFLTIYILSFSLSGFFSTFLHLCSIFFNLFPISHSFYFFFYFSFCIFCFSFLLSLSLSNFFFSIFKHSFFQHFCHFLYLSCILSCYCPCFSPPANLFGHFFPFLHVH